MLGEHGSFRRYVMTAMVNFIVFYSLWELFVLILQKRKENFLLQKKLKAFWWRILKHMSNGTSVCLIYLILLKK